MYLPMLLHLHIPTDDGSYGLWLPWFAIYPLLLALMLTILPIILITAIILLPLGKARPFILAGPYLWQLLAAMGGLRAEIRTGHRDVLVNFI